jgi:hypothetical protein
MFKQFSDLLQSLSVMSIKTLSKYPNKYIGNLWCHVSHLVDIRDKHIYCVCLLSNLN